MLVRDAFQWQLADAEKDRDRLMHICLFGTRHVCVLATRRISWHAGRCQVLTRIGWVAVGMKTLRPAGNIR
jgi:hypothetical protein